MYHCWPSSQECVGCKHGAYICDTDGDYYCYEAVSPRSKECQEIREEKDEDDL